MIRCESRPRRGRPAVVIRGQLEPRAALRVRIEVARLDFEDAAVREFDILQHRVAHSATVRRLVLVHVASGRHSTLGGPRCSSSAYASPMDGRRPALAS